MMKPRISTLVNILFSETWILPLIWVYIFVLYVCFRLRMNDWSKPFKANPPINFGGVWIAEKYHTRLRSSVCCTMPWALSSSLGDDRLFLDPSTTSMLSSWFYLVYLIWYYYFSVKFVMWIVNRKLKIKENYKKPTYLFCGSDNLKDFFIYFLSQSHPVSFCAHVLWGCLQINMSIFLSSCERFLCLSRV